MKQLIIAPGDVFPELPLEGLTYSETAIAKGVPNVPDADDLKNLARLVVSLVMVAEMLGQRIKLTSAFRSDAVNGAIREIGAKKSAHTDGRAGDIVPLDGMGLPDAFDVLRKSPLNYDQVILESGCVHWAIPKIGETRIRRALIRHGKPGAWTYTEAV